MKLKLQTVVELSKSIQGLVDYRFDAATTLTLAKNVKQIRDSLTVVDVKRAEMLKEFGNPLEDMKDENYKQFALAFQKYAAEVEVEADLKLIPYEKLNIGDSDRLNHIPPGHVSELLPILIVPENN